MSDTLRDLRPVAWPNRATPERLPYEVDFAPFLAPGRRGSPVFRSQGPLLLPQAWWPSNPGHPA